MNETRGTEPIKACVLILGSPETSEIVFSIPNFSVKKLILEPRNPQGLPIATEKALRNDPPDSVVILFGEDLLADLTESWKFLGLKFPHSSGLGGLLKTRRTGPRPGLPACPCTQVAVLSRRESLTFAERRIRRLEEIGRSLDSLAVLVKPRVKSLLLASPPFMAEFCPDDSVAQSEEAVALASEACAYRASSRFEEAFGLFLLAREKSRGSGGGMLSMKEITERVAEKHGVPFVDLADTLFEAAGSYMEADRIYFTGGRLNPNGAEAVGSLLAGAVGQAGAIPPLAADAPVPR